jgi:hypothetical protein
MLTFFTIPKPFRGHVAIIQRNAIRSWALLQPASEVILFGNDEGTAEVASELGVRHVPNIVRNEYGTPLVDDVFEKAQDLAGHNLLCYVNADIILMSGFIQAVEQVASQKPRFLMVGQRHDLDVQELLDFRLDWEDQLRVRLTQNGQLHPPAGIDYFAFPRGLWEEIPPFAIGRTGWDNWLLYGARMRGAALVDATPVVMIIHQNHDYAHLVGGQEAAWKGVEAQQNLKLVEDRVFNLLDANWILTSRGLRPALTYAHLRRLPYNWLALRPSLRWLFRAIYGPGGLCHLLVRREQGV